MDAVRTSRMAGAQLTRSKYSSRSPLLHVSPLEATVNPPDYDYNKNEYHVRLDAARRIWDNMAEATHQYCDEALRRETLGDDYQQLFVDIVMNHVQALTEQMRNPKALPVKPLRLLLLGTAARERRRRCKQLCRKCLGICSLSASPSILYA